ncbi:hypothetical protein ABZ342_35675 [Amycolatopsis sp. NPDC005961]|uniref:hypothetical protein n=1 Tax=Amycolatopsis sp. NPDC005961 TaxID=3156720 RepID=UPI0033E4F6E7
MDLDRALAVMRTETHIRGRSDHALALSLAKKQSSVMSKPLLPASGLHGGVRFRPCEVLHLLSYVTRPRYQADLHDVYVQWGLLRYLGFFDLEDSGYPLTGLSVSAAGRRITGNQRRVTSEEMGIAFGALLALHWVGHSGATNVPISVVDIDAALDDRYVYAAGARQTVRKTGTLRPDYLLVVHDPSLRTRYRVRVLECKGTKSRSYGPRQLAHAVEQLGGVTVGGRTPAGLAVSTITSDDGLFYYAIDPPDEEEPSYEVTSGTIEDAHSFRFTNDAQMSPTRLVSASVRTAWATLADFGGNLSALDRWAPGIMRNRLTRQSRDRVTFETPFGSATGTSVTFSFDGARLTVRHAIDTRVDEQLTRGEAEDVSEAQRSFAERLSGVPDRDREANQREAVSATPDGSIFSLRRED